MVFLAGCNFRCPYCHNHPLVLRPEGIPSIPLGRILARLADFRGWVDGVVITGGEPTIHPDLPDLARALKGAHSSKLKAQSSKLKARSSQLKAQSSKVEARSSKVEDRSAKGRGRETTDEEEGLLVKLHTNGSRPALLRTLLEERLVDCVAMDLKAPLVAERYRRAAGADVDVAAIRECVNLLREIDIPYEFRTTVVPSLHTAEDVVAIAREVQGASRLILQSFRSDNPLDAALRAEAPYGREELERFAAEARRFVAECRVEA